MRESIEHDDPVGLENLFVGRKVVSVDESRERLTLDDGTVVRVIPNYGCGGCTSGGYGLAYLNTCDNIITSVEVETFNDGDDYGTTVYTVFVYAENNVVNDIIAVSGSDGNGYYGTGFRLEVVRDV